MTEAELQELKDKVNKLWDARVRIDMPLVERTVIANIAKIAAMNTQGGSVASGGTANAFFPLAWTVAKTATGTYTVTHNLGTLRYSTVVTPATTSRVASIATPLTNSVVVKISDLAGALTDTDFYISITR